MSSSQDGWQTMDGTCPECDKTWRVCECRKVARDATILSTVAKNAIVDEKCGRFVKIEPLNFSLSLQQNGYGHTQLQLNQMVEKINEIIDAVNELKEQSK